MTGFRRAGAVCALFVSLTGCGGRAQVAAPQEALVDQCSETWPSARPELETSPELTWPTSHLSVTAGVPVKQLLAEIKRQVPEHLAQNRRQSVGKAGRATYSVRRLEPRLETPAGALEIHVPIEATVNVCKPFGPACIRYGHCKPAFLATFRVPSVLGKDYAIAPPRGSLEATRRCVIGLDVTPQILSEARKEIRSVERQLAGSLPALGSPVQRLWEAAQEPRQLTEDICLRFIPAQLSHAPVRLIKGNLETVVGLSGALALDACDADDHPASPLPALRTQRGAFPPSRLWLPTKVAFHELGAALEQQLELPAGQQLSAIEVTGSGERLAVRLGVVGQSCGDVWLSARPTFDASAGQLQLGDVMPLAPEAGRGAALAAELAPKLEAVRLPVAVGMDHALSLLRSWTELAREAGHRIDLELTTEPGDLGTASVHRGGLAVAAALETRAKLVVRELTPRP